jgi:atrial natriuretic peptide receptor A
MIIHPNMHRFVGICLDEHNYCQYIIGEVCGKGTLEDILQNDKIQLDWAFKHSMIKDLTEV